MDRECEVCYEVGRVYRIRPYQEEEQWVCEECLKDLQGLRPERKEE